MLTFIALFMIPVLIMAFRHRILNISGLEIVKIVAEYAMIILTDAFFSLFAVRCIIRRAPLDVSSFSSVQFFLKYCVVATVIGLLSVCLEKYVREHLPKDWHQILKNRFEVAASQGLLFVDGLENRTYGKRKYHLDEVFFVALGFIIAALVLTRCFFGIEITDEAYYVADAYSVYQGNLPFAHNTSNAAGMSLVAYPFMFLFRLFSSNNDGVFLYMRLSFTVFRFAIIMLVCSILRNRYSRRAIIPASVLLIAWSTSLSNFSYNNSSFWLMLLSCVLAFKAHNETKRKSWILLYISGWIAALSAFAHPMQAGAVLAMCVLLIVLSEKKQRFTRLCTYVVGMISQVLVVFGAIAIQTGFANLFTGIDIMLFHRLKYAEVSTKQRFIDFLIWLKPLYGRLILLFLFSMIAFWVLDEVLKLRWKIRYRWLLSAVAALIPVVVYHCRGGSDSAFSYFGAISFWMIIMILPVVRDVFAYYVVFPFLAFFICEVIFPGLGSASGRVYFMWPTSFVIIVLLGKYGESVRTESDKASGKMLKIVVGMFACITAILVVHSEYLYVYRDDPISQLDYQVSEGIYKGIYTTKDRAECTIEVEKYIKRKTESSELISFRDNVPFGYLMSNGVMCDIRTWDAMQYSYVVSEQVEDNPINLYRYYKSTRRIPDKYIYIDYGRDETVSYNNPTFKFNKWLNAYYKELESIKINDRYSVRIYEYNGEFDGNYDYWINSIQEQ